MVFLVSTPREDPNLYTTATGEQSSVPLLDGSLVVLNTRSTLRVAFSEAYRDVHLADGEALFDVAKEAGRPFGVFTGKAVIQVVGTQFNVRTTADGVTVTVVEGVVDVSTAAAEDVVGTGALDGQNSGFDLPRPVRLKVGQRAQIKSDSAETVIAEALVEDTIAWRQHRLVFNALPLKQVIEEFNRYKDPPVVIEDQTLESLPISGVFRSNNRDSFLQFLSRMELAESSTRTDGTIVLTVGRGNQPPT